MFQVNIKNILGFTLFLLLSSQSLQAITVDYFVTPLGDGTECIQTNPCSLQTALSSSVSNDTIYLGAGNYTRHDTIIVMTISKDITVLGGWDGTTITPVVRNPDLYVSIIDGENNRGCVEINGGLNVTLEGMTIANALFNEVGAGLFVENSGSLMLKKIIFSQNYAHDDEISSIMGGGAYINGGTVDIEDCKFIQNSAISDTSSKGGALAIIEAHANIKTTTFEENDAQAYSSALYFKGGSSLYTLRLFGNTFINNSKQTSIGGAEGLKKGTLAIYDADANLTNNVFKNNEDISGSTIVVQRSRLMFTNNIVANNQGSLSNIYIYDAPFFGIINSIFNDNHAVGASSIFVQTVEEGYFINNTIANNNVDNAIKIGSKGSLDDIVMTNNIITGHETGILLGSSSILDISATLWGVGSSANTVNISSTGTLTQTDDVIGDPSYVDETNGDYHIKANSAAKDSGLVTVINFDIDGDSRPKGGGFDIGADELVGSSINPALIMYLLN